MNCQIIFSRKNKKNISKLCLLKILPSMQSVNSYPFPMEDNVKSAECNIFTMILGHRKHFEHITKTRLFKNIENLTTKN